MRRLSERHLTAAVLLVVCVLLVSGCARSMMPTPVLYRVAPSLAFDRLPEELRGNRIQVLYVTDREPAAPGDGRGRFYGSDRSASAAFGVADVAFRGLDRDLAGVASDDAFSADAAKRLSRGPVRVEAATEAVRFPATPRPFEVSADGSVRISPAVAERQAQANALATAEIRRRLALTPRKDVYLFIHGVGNQFDDALIAAGEFWHFLGREGVPISYTWPSGAGGLNFYTADRESGEFTILHLKDFLRLLASIPEIERIHIAAHSRGTDVASTALRELIIESRAAGRDPRAEYRVENLVLVAADLDLEVALQRLVGEAMGPAIGRITVYTNTRDSALAAARALFRSRQRLGAVTLDDLGPRKRRIIDRTDNLDIIVYEGSGGGFYRHGYFRDPVASSDMILLLRYDLGPGEGRRRDALERIGPRMWRLRD